MTKQRVSTYGDKIHTLLFTKPCPEKDTALTKTSQWKRGCYYYLQIHMRKLVSRRFKSFYSYKIDFPNGGRSCLCTLGLFLQFFSKSQLYQFRKIKICYQKCIYSPTFYTWMNQRYIWFHSWLWKTATLIY